MSKYLFIDTQRVENPLWPIWLLCATLEVPESSYYDWNRNGRANHAARCAADEAMTARIREVHAESEGTYGAPRIKTELAEGGIIVSKRRIAALMAAGQIQGLSGREHSTTTTRRDRLAAPFPDLVNRQFLVEEPNTLWYGDVTYIWVGNRFWYLATVIDAATKEVIGWRFADHMEASLVADALRAAVARRGSDAVGGVVFHSDRGSQYTSAEFGRVCALFGVRQSMGKTGICYDNAAAESFFATLKRELIHRHHWDNAGDLHSCLFEWIEAWYNRKRRHTSIGMQAPSAAYTQYLNRPAA